MAQKRLAASQGWRQRGRNVGGAHRLKHGKEEEVRLHGLAAGEVGATAVEQRGTRGERAIEALQHVLVRVPANALYTP